MATAEVTALPPSDVSMEIEEAPGLVNDEAMDEQTDAVPDLESCADEVAFETMSWDRMCDLMTPAQMALIHQTEHMGDHLMIEWTLTEVVRADDNWQEQFHSLSGLASDADSDQESIDPDDPMDHC